MTDSDEFGNCMCDMASGSCDLNCCCDPDCEKYEKDLLALWNETPEKSCKDYDEKSRVNDLTACLSEKLVRDIDDL